MKRSINAFFLALQVVVRPSNAPEEVTVFECNRWLDVNEDDGLIVREITSGGSQMLSSE